MPHIPSRPADRRPRVTLERAPYEPEAWDAIVARHEDAEVYHTSAWLRFLASTQHATPVVAIVRADGQPVGHFVGAVVRRLGLRVLGSPLRGWTTQCMGFLLDGGVERRAAAEALLPFAFGELGCHHVELADRRLDADAMAGSPFRIEAGISFRSDLRRSEAEILGGFHRTARKELRRAERAGLRVEAATDGAFVDEYYGYLRDTFARQGLAPTYPIERVRALVDELGPSGRLLLLRAHTAEGRSVAASLSVGYGRAAVIWGMGFDRDLADDNAVELLWWETIRAWRARGAATFDFAGGGAYKAKYGGVVAPTAHFYRSRWPILAAGPTVVRRWARMRQVLGNARAGIGRRPVATRPGGRPDAP